MPIEITDVAHSTWIVIALLLAALLPGRRRECTSDPLPVAVTQQLKGLGILTIVFAHIAYMLVSDSHFLFPLSVAAGVGVDLFLLLSGYGLTMGMLRSPLAPLPFYRRRMLRVFIPFWIVLALVFVADRLLLGRAYAPGYVLQSMLGWFPRASSVEDVNSPLWYISLLLLFYLLFPLLFSARRPWLSALALAVIANAVAFIDPLHLDAGWLHRLHTIAFSLGMLLAWLGTTRPSTGAALVRIRDQRPPVSRWLAMAACLVVALYAVSHKTAGDWPKLAALLQGAALDPGVVIEQCATLLATGVVLLLFVLARRETALLALFGTYSYETYLLHWPLMSRYDVFYHTLPAWLATIAWLGAFLALGWLLQRAVSAVEALFDARPVAGAGQRRAIS